VPKLVLMKPKRPDYIKNVSELHTPATYNYPGDTETFGTGAALGLKTGLTKLGFNFELLAPGDRTAWPHAHSTEEELIYILEGTPQIWIDGYLYDLRPGDTVGFPCGTGIAHCLLNNSDHDVRAIVIGERDPKDDKIFYPLHPDRNEEMKARGSFWIDHPVRELGPHDGWTERKRPSTAAQK
jgi:uncharacterized cupin superfamily protein